jgi:hypothetical protein
MATVDHGDSAILFISMAGFGVPGPEVVDPATHYPVTVRQATVLRLELAIEEGKPPVLRGQTVIGDGYAQRADRDNFVFGPTGLALGPDDTLYVTDGLDNEITAIPEASTRSASAGKGKLVTKDGLLGWPLAMVMTPEGHLVVCNGKNGQAVEIDPATGRQIYAQWLDPNQAQSPPGNGDLFGIALALDGKSFYYVEDDVNALVIATP